jgi:hypothetical protein
LERGGGVKAITRTASAVKNATKVQLFAEFSNSERLSEQLSKKLGRKVDIRKKEKKRGEKWFWEQKMKNLFLNEMIRQKMTNSH